MQRNDDLYWYAQTRDVALRDQLAIRHLPLVKFVARRMAGSLPSHIELDDLVSWGTLGLLDALDKFDPTREVKFSTYAVTRIRGAILDGLQKMDWAPKQITSKVRAMRRLREQLANELGRYPTVEEMADRLGVDVEDVRGWLVDDAATRVKPLETGQPTGTGGDSEPTIRGDLAEDADQEIAGEVAEIRARVSRAVMGLGERERAVLLLYYREGWTLREVAAQLGVSVSSATQTHTRLVEQIRDRLALFGGMCA